MIIGVNLAITGTIVLNPPEEGGGGGGEINPDPGFDTGSWVLAGENDPPLITGNKLVFNASELGLQTATIALAQTYPAGAYQFSVDIDSISGVGTPTVTTSLRLDGADVPSTEGGSATFLNLTSAGAAQTGTRNPTDSFNQIRVHTTSADAVVDNVSLMAA